MTRRKLLVALAPFVLAAAALAARSHADSLISGTLTVDTGATPEAWCNHVTVDTGGANRVVAGMLTIGCPLPNGSPCGGASDCISTNCIDGFCCNTACNGACDACNVAGSLGTCRASAAGSVCRAAAGACDQQETCDGTSTACPADTFRAAGSVCRADNGGGCDVAEACTGASPSCPADVGRPTGWICDGWGGSTCGGTAVACATNSLPAGNQNFTTVCPQP